MKLKTLIMETVRCSSGKPCVLVFMGMLRPVVCGTHMKAKVQDFPAEYREIRETDP